MSAVEFSISTHLNVLLAFFVLGSIDKAYRMQDSSHLSASNRPCFPPVFAEIDVPQAHEHRLGYAEPSGHKSATLFVRVCFGERIGWNPRELLRTRVRLDNIMHNW